LYYRGVLDYTWSDLEAEIVLRNLNVPVEEQRRLRDYYLKLREEYRKATDSPAPIEPEEAAG
jgi:hypothetical protein